MSVALATGGWFNPCNKGIGGGAPPVYQYEARGEDFPIYVKVKSVKLLEPEESDKISVKVSKVTSK